MNNVLERYKKNLPINSDLFVFAQALKQQQRKPM